MQGALPSNNVPISGSKSISLAFYDENNLEKEISESQNYFYFSIPRDNNPLPSFEKLNTSNVNQSFNLLTLNGFLINKNNVSIHYHIKPNNKQLGYFTTLKFGSNPHLNSTFVSFDMWNIFCPNDLKNESSELFHIFFANMSHTINFKGFVGFGIKELNTKEFKYFCSTNMKKEIKMVDLLNNLDLDIKTNFSSFVSTRVILSGCYYVDKLTGSYSSNGMEVLNTTNTTHTQCRSNHLTQFAGGWITVPSGINFNDVFARASFLDNITIYMTCIVITLFYFILFIWTQYMDNKDKLKTNIKILNDLDYSDDIYFYEIIFYTGNRFNAGTKSNIKFKLFGQCSESRIFNINNNKDNKYSFQRGSIDSFVISCAE